MEAGGISKDYKHNAFRRNGVSLSFGDLFIRLNIFPNTYKSCCDRVTRQLLRVGQKMGNPLKMVHMKL
jgi:hypothetical protein